MAISNDLRDRLKQNARREIYSKTPTALTKFLKKMYLTYDELFDLSIQRIECSLESLSINIDLKDRNAQADAFAGDFENIREAVDSLEFLFRRFVRSQEAEAQKSLVPIST